MSETRELTHHECLHAVRGLLFRVKDGRKIYGVPRGGVSVAYLCLGCSVATVLVDDPAEADFIVDDIVDSGKTRDRYKGAHPGTPFLALADFLAEKKKPGQWLVFPWEKTDGNKDCSGDDIVVRLLQYIGEDPNREGLRETPGRVLRAWKEWAVGYAQDPAEVLKCFEDGGEKYDEMVVVKDLPFYSNCEHHLTAFFGTATIAYIPDRRVIGLSKLGRVLGIYARRLQVQERLTTLVADAVQVNLNPKGVGVLIKARHLCMESRGLSNQGHHTITSALRGVFLEDGKVRQEFFSIAQS